VWWSSNPKGVSRPSDLIEKEIFGESLRRETTLKSSDQFAEEN
jgi:hypothetical protein